MGGRGHFGSGFLAIRYVYYRKGVDARRDVIAPACSCLLLLTVRVYLNILFSPPGSVTIITDTFLIIVTLDLFEMSNLRDPQPADQDGSGKLDKLADSAIQRTCFISPSLIVMNVELQINLQEKNRNYVQNA